MNQGILPSSMAIWPNKFIMRTILIINLDFLEKSIYYHYRYFGDGFYIFFFFPMTTLVSTDAAFIENISTGVTLVDFWAEWCGPCQMMLPRLSSLAEKMGDRAKIMKHNVDTDPQIPSQFRIMSIPTIILFKDGQPVEKFVGVQEVDHLAQAIEKHLAA